METRQTGYIRLVSDNTISPNRIRELRDAIGMSQAELARRIHVTPSALQKVEIGARKLDQEWMRRVAAVLDVSPAEILPVDDNPWMLSEDEKHLLEQYRRSRDEDRDKLRRVADVVLEFRGPDKDAA